MLGNIDYNYENLKEVENIIYVDVRTPEEWSDGNIPGSINIPIFSNEERAEVGYIYKQISHKQARDRGIEIVSPKLPSLIKEIENLSSQGQVVIYCWRGGSRSKSIAYLLNILNIKVKRLIGGYKSYRKTVMAYLETYDFEQNYLVLNGMTGVGKTIILNKLEEAGYPVLDLEEFAGHRGSIFGQLSLNTINTQKQFDALLFERLEEIGGTKYFIIEAESKRLGKAVVPAGIMQGKEKGQHVIIDADLAIREKRILEEYLKDNKREVLLSGLDQPLKYLQKRLNKDLVSEIEDAIREEDIEKIIKLLMLEHYDQKYNHTIKNYEKNAYKVSSNDIEIAYKKIKEIIEEKEYEHTN